jgi:hypothetical protein
MKPPFTGARSSAASEPVFSEALGHTHHNTLTFLSAFNGQTLPAGLLCFSAAMP